MHLFLLGALFLAPLDTATFAGGCFWSMEHPFDHLNGVVSVTVGFMGGRTFNPSYEDVVTGRTGHLESVQVVFDARKVGYAKLLEAFWHNIDPFQVDGQACDHGPQYQSAIFYRDTVQQRLAEQTKRRLGVRFQRAIVTQVRAAARRLRRQDRLIVRAERRVLDGVVGPAARARGSGDDRRAS